VGRALFTENGAQRRKLLALGLGSAIFLHALTDAFLSVPDLGTASLALPVMGLVLFWGWRLVKALRDEQDQLSEVLEHREQRLATGRFSTSSEPVPDVAWTAVPPLPPRERTSWAWTKLILGGLGLGFCGLLWYTTILLAHDKLPNGTTGDAVAVGLISLFFNVLPTWLCFLLFRSGLREPFETPSVS